MTPEKHQEAGPSSFDFLSGGGEMGALMRAHDWTATPLGPPAGWPVLLKTTVGLVLNSSHPMFIWWGEELTQFYNDAYRQSLDAARHPAALGQRGRECWADIWEVIGPQIEQVMSSGGATWHENQYLPVERDGMRRDTWWTYGFSPLQDEAGVRGVLVVCNEVTGEQEGKARLERINRILAQERNRISAALEQSRAGLAQQVQDWQRLHAMGSALLQARSVSEQFRLVLDTVAGFHQTSQAVVSLHDAEQGGLVVQASLGVDEAGLAALSCVPLGAGACGAAFQERRRVVVADTATDPLYADYREFASKQGIRALYSTPFFDVAGEPLGVLSVYFATARQPTERELQLTDICAAQIASFVERNRAHAQLRREQERSDRMRRLYQTLLQNTPDLAYVFDLDHRFTYANEVLLQMWGKTWDEAIGKNCLELGYEPWHAEMHSREIEQVKATKRPIRGEVPFDGTFGRRIYDYIFVPVLGPDGEVEAVAGTSRDVTERKQNEEALREANLRKDEFLAMLGHELRNPLAPISAAAELIERARLDEERLKSTSRIISRQVRHMTGLVDDLLDASRVSRGLVSIEQQLQDIRGVVRSAVEQVRPLMESQRHRLTLSLADEPLLVLGDQKRLVQILTNLLNNAAKYTPAGGNVSLELEADAAQLRLSVQDDGVGIAPEMQPRVFELFTQAQQTAARSQGGLGIGLALVKSLVELHGGRVDCESAGIGKGSRFTVTLPRRQESGDAAIHPPRPTQVDSAAGSLRILVVDDNADAAQALAFYLETAGHAVAVEFDSLRALERAQLERPDVCLLDIGLPEMDGNQLARHLRAQPETAGALLVAVSGYGQEQDRRAALAAGFDHYLVKPVDLVQLASILAARQPVAAQG